MMYFRALCLNCPVTVAYLILIMYNLKCLTLLTWMMRKTIYHVLILILTAATTMNSVFLFKRIATNTMMIPSITLFWKFFQNSDLFSLIHLNIRSTPANLSKLIQYKSNLNVNFDIIGLSETWLTETKTDIYNLDGYDHVPLVRPDRIHGGVSLFISTAITYRVLNEFSMINRDIECLFVEIEFNNIKMYVEVIYRTPDADIRNFCDYLINILESPNPPTQSCYLMGDYNLDLLKHSTHNPTSEFLDLMFSNSFIPLINKPTRITPKSATVIDNIFANEYENEHRYMTGILTTDISDHYPIFHISLNQNKPKEEEYQMIRLINGSNLEK